jgi:hypothetical protein
MSFRQRLIVKYLAGLTTPTYTKYHLHLLRHEEDDSARHMLEQNLTKVAEETHHARLQTITRELAAQRPTSIAFGARDKRRAKAVLKDQTPTPTDAGQEGSIFLSALLLEDALLSFEHSKRDPHRSYNDKFYRQRSEIHLVLGNYGEALSLAQKGRLIEFEFVAAVSSGQFDTAARCSGSVLRSLTFAHSERKAVISTFELAHLIMFIAFGTATSEAARALLLDVTQQIGYDLDWLVDISHAFVGREFGAFVGHFHAIYERLRMSIHTESVADSLLQAMRDNVVRNVVRPLARISLALLAAQVGIPDAEVGDALRRLLREGRAVGKVDFAAGEFVAIGASAEGRQMAATLARTLVVGQTLDTAQWRLLYAEQRERERLSAARRSGRNADKPTA